MHYVIYTINCIHVIKAIDCPLENPAGAKAAANHRDLKHSL